MPSITITVRVSEKEAAEIDVARGGQSRASWVAVAITTALNAAKPAPKRKVEAGACPHPRGRVIKGFCYRCGKPAILLGHVNPGVYSFPPGRNPGDTTVQEQGRQRPCRTCGRWRAPSLAPRGRSPGYPFGRQRVPVLGLAGGRGRSLPGTRAGPLNVLAGQSWVMSGKPGGGWHLGCGLRTRQSLHAYSPDHNLAPLAG